MTGQADLLRVKQYSIESLQKELERAQQQNAFLLKHVEILEARIEVANADIQEFIKQ
tara:strand:+ start:920 stop:1090 length:171 start_codon:yes stop_codon:yes gene_type:complete